MAPFGYVPLAENAYGDMYLYDLNHIGADGWPRIVFASHEAIGGPDDTKETIEDALGEGADNLPEFLRMAAKGELEEDRE